MVLFKNSKTRETSETKKLLKGYERNITNDDYARYDSVAKVKITIQRCMVHARREFANHLKQINEEERQNSVSYEVVKKIDLIFDKEKEFKQKNFHKKKI